MNDQTAVKEMNAFSRIVGIFTSPRETFESINTRPTWLVPFLIIVIASVAMQYVVMDIATQDQITIMQARGMSQDQLDAIQNRMEGPAQYIQLGAIVLVTPIIWSILALVLMLGGNSILGGNAKFKTFFSMVAWSGMIGLLGGIIKILLIKSKGTSVGVTTSLAVLTATPAPGETPSILYRLLSKLDLFTIWTLALWIIGLSVVARCSTKKSAGYIVAIWIVWIVISVALGGVFSRFGA